MDDTLEKLKTLIANNDISSEALAAQVVAYRTLGIGKEVSIVCMEELGRRRASGEEFPFETYIETESAKVPKPDLTQLKTINDSFTIQALSKLIKKK